MTAFQPLYIYLLIASKLPHSPHVKFYTHIKTNMQMYITDEQETEEADYS